MRLIEAEIENFMGYTGVHTLRLNSLGLVNISGVNLDDPGNNSNGAAKTTILEALTWCLFGEGLPRRQGNTEKGVSADEVIPDSLKGQTRVTVHLQDDAKPEHIAVVRWRKYKEGKAKRTSGVTVREDGQDFTYLDMAEGTKHVKRVLGIDRDIWVRSVIFGQESAFNFCEATAKDRADILTTVMGLEEVDRWLGRCRDERTNLRPILAHTEGQCEALQEQLVTVEQEDPQVQIDQWEAQKATQLAAQLEHQQTVEVQGKLLRAQLDALPPPPMEPQPPPQPPPLNLPSVPEIRPPEFPEAPVLAVAPELGEALEKARLEKARAQETVNSLHQTVVAAERQLEQIQTFHQTAQCPTCGQVIQEDHKQRCEAEAAGKASQQRKFLAGEEAKVSGLEETFQTTKAAYDRAQGDVKTAQASYRIEIERAQARHQAAVAAAQASHRAEVEAIQANHRAEVTKAQNCYQAEVTNYRSLMTERQDLEAKVNQVRMEWVAVGNEAQRIQDQANPYLQVREQWTTRLQDLQTKIQEVNEQRAQKQEQMAILNWWDSEFPRFKTWLFDSVVDTLAVEANRWIKVMTGGVLWVQISTQKATAKGALKDEIDVQLHRWNPDGTITCRPYRVWSGGEKRRVALAVDLGLSRLMAQRASKPYKFLALDEVDRHLDAQGREGLREVLEELRRERETTLVITHDPEFKATFDKEIRVTKQGGSSTMEMIDHGSTDQGEAQEAAEDRQAG